MTPPADFLELDGRTLLVTGASSGIGRAVAIEAGVHGARLALVARRESVLREVRDELAGDGHIVVPFDLGNLDEIPAMVRAASDELGGLDGLVHAAGGHQTQPLRLVTGAEITSLLSQNVATALMLAKGFRHKQVRSESSSIVLVSSAIGLVGQAGVSTYSATKGAIASLTRSLALELAREGIRVNNVAPGIVLTELTETIRTTVGDDGFRAIELAHPLGFGQPADVAKAILYLLSPASRWVTGSSLVVDGGYTAQ